MLHRRTHQELVYVHACVHSNAPPKVVVKGLLSTTSRGMIAEELGKVLCTHTPVSRDFTVFTSKADATAP